MFHFICNTAWKSAMKYPRRHAPMFGTRSNPLNTQKEQSLSEPLNLSLCALSRRCNNAPQKSSSRVVLQQHDESHTPMSRVLIVLPKIPVQTSIDCSRISCIAPSVILQGVSLCYYICHIPQMVMFFTIQ
jgi:hypothetical protein